VVTVEQLLEEVTERQATRGDSVSALVLAKIAPSGSLQSQRKNVDLKEIQPGSPVEMMFLVRVPEQSLTTGLVGAMLRTIGVLTTSVSSSSSSESLITQEMMMLTGITCILLLTPASFHI